jgi:D-Tyr-tRNAtyr deacylase
VARASVCVDDITVPGTFKGLLILFGAEKQGTPYKVQCVIDKVLTLSIFPDAQM